MIDKEQIHVDANNMDSFCISINDVDYSFYYNFLLSGDKNDFDNYRLLKVAIRNANFRFGSCGIRIGSTFDEDKSAYRKNMTCYEVAGEGRGVY